MSLLLWLLGSPLAQVLLSKKTYTLSRINRLDLSVDFPVVLPWKCLEF